MFKALIALCIVAAVQASAAYEIAVPVMRQRYGVGETRIIGGTTAKRGQFPHQAGITMDGQAFCGGSLISPIWVLTAGHCVDGFKSWVVVLGAQNINDGNEAGRVKLSSTNAIKHEKYYRPTITNDIGVIRLPSEVKYTEFIKAIALPPLSLKNQNLTGKITRVSGWGKTEDNGGISPTLQYVDLPLISNEECKKVFGESIVETKYCCSGANQRSTCNGDSGGSLTIGEGANLVNLGIVSFGHIAGCTKGYPIGFTATPHFVEWVSNKTGIPVKP